MWNPGPAVSGWVMVLAVAAAAAATPPPRAPVSAISGPSGPPKPGEGLSGSWEGFITETPARLTLVGVALERSGERWEGTIDELRRLPVRVHWFSDGLFVVRATSAQHDTLRCRVTAIAGRDLRQVRERVARLFAGNESWVDDKSPYFMTSPEILYGLRMVAEMEKVPFALDCGDRGAIVRTLAPLPLRRSKEPTEAWRELSPRWRGDGDGDGWRNALADGPSLPLYLQDPNRHYWFEYLAKNEALYVQYNRSQDG